MLLMYCSCCKSLVCFAKVFSLSVFVETSGENGNWTYVFICTLALIQNLKYTIDI